MFGIWVSELERIWKRKSMLFLNSILLFLVLINIWSLKINGFGEFRFGEGRILMHDLNMPWFMMSGVSLFFVLAILPVIYVDHLGGEIHSGAYRLYMLRPFHRYQLWLAKLLALAVTTVIMIIFTYIIAVICAKLFFPQSETLVKYGESTAVGKTEALLYTVKFYALFTVTCLTKLMFSSVICLFVPKPIIAYIVLFAASITLYQIAKPLIIVFDPFQQILLALRTEGAPEFWIYALGTTAVCTVVSFLCWQRKVV
ncbi:ABC transporter permease [Paenibacillus sp. 481]|uniref:ABC transporter permease n=1 Tax=Paenibacillus sp. 481 TaxID=2835869 RepID=UPI001E48C26C|nr:ABC transporter permease [Paenibacillus sp. 481]UHA73646.1 ABC transporter permease [Paenibacillus sp. 481]